MVINIKKIAMLLFVSATMLSVSCSKEEKAGPIDGTSWKCENTTSYEGYNNCKKTLIFTFTTTSTGTRESMIECPDNPEINRTDSEGFTYTYDDPDGSIKMEKDAPYTFSVSGNKMTLTGVSGNTWILTKQ